MCRSQGQAVAALARLTALLAELGLQPKPAKTRIVQLAVDGGGVDFLGFHHRLVQSRARRGPNRLTYLARWPSRKAMQHARDRIRFMTMRARLAAPVEEVVQDINTFLRGWAGYFRYGNSAHTFDKIRSYALMRVALFMGKRHQRGRAWGFARRLPITQPARPDLPQRNRRRPQAQPGLAGSGRTPPVKDVGEPCAGEPHARFDGRELETEHADQGHRGGTAERETGGTQAPGPTSQPLPPRQLPTQPTSWGVSGRPCPGRVLGRSAATHQTPAGWLHAASARQAERSMPPLRGRAAFRRSATSVAPRVGTLVAADHPEGDSR